MGSIRPGSSLQNPHNQTELAYFPSKPTAGRGFGNILPYGYSTGDLILAAIGTERVLKVHHWTDTQFTFTTTRDSGLRFENGQFVMVGLHVDERPLMRAYSIASANHEEHLEFLSIKVPDGPLTSRLQHIQIGRASCRERV